MKRLLLPVLAAALAAGLVTACSGDDGRVAEPADVATSTIGAPSSGSSADASSDSAAIDPSETTPDEAVGSTAATPTAQIEVPETGIPGLDSDDRFCAAWSRFGGSWQVLSVGSSFLGDPERVAAWEVSASAVIGEAYLDLIDDFPQELATEADTVANGYFGVLYRRALDAGAELLIAGADTDAITRLSDAWLAALAVRDPADPDLRFSVPDDLKPLVTEAATAFTDKRVDFHLDPSMVVSVATPLTDAFLETACPDQGTLTGQEIDGN